MAIRFVDRRAHLGQLGAAVDGAQALLQGVHVRPAQRTGVVGTQLSPLSLGMLGAFTTSANRSGVLPAILDALQVNAIGTFRTPGASDPLAVRDPDGTDLWLDLDRNTNGAGTPGNPLQKSQFTTASAYQALSAGRQLVQMNGSGSATFTPVSLTSGMPSGNASARITIRTMPGHPRPIWNFPTVGCVYATNYWDFRDIDARTNGCGWRFGYNGWGGDGTPHPADVMTSHTRIIDCLGTRTAGGILDGKTTDNRGIVTAANNNGAAEFIDVMRCQFFGPASEGNNESLIWFDYIRNCSIVGNLLVGGANPIYFKHLGTPNATNYALVKNNIIRNGGLGCRCANDWVRWINNAFEGCHVFADEEGGGAFAGNNWTWNHNTIVNSRWFMAAESSNLRSNLSASDNVMIGSNARFYNMPSSSQNGNNNIDYSAVDGNAHYWRAGTNYTMAAYKSAYPTQEVHGQSGTCQLVGGTSPGNTPANWALTSGSVGRGNASDGGDRGVNPATLLTAN